MQGLGANEGGRFARNTLLKNSHECSGGTCPPCLFDFSATAGGREGGSFRESFALLDGVECCAFPTWSAVGRSVGRTRGHVAGVATQQPRSQVRPAPHPVAAKSLSVALGRVPAVAPSHGVPAGNQSAVRVTSPIEAVPRRKVDVQNTMQSVRGFGIITRNGAIRR